MAVDPRLMPPEAPRPSPLLDHDELLAPQWELDWDRYWLEFSSAHGGCPIQMDDWIVFEDGWSHDAYDIGGTERPPPGDVAYDYASGTVPSSGKLRELLASYYRVRRDRARVAHRNLAFSVDGIKQLRAMKNQPLRIRSVTWSEGRGADGFSIYTPILDEGELGDREIKKLEIDLEWLANDVRRCEERIESLKEERHD